MKFQTLQPNKSLWWRVSLMLIGSFENTSTTLRMAIFKQRCNRRSSLKWVLITLSIDRFWVEFAKCAMSKSEFGLKRLNRDLGFTRLKRHTLNNSNCELMVIMKTEWVNRVTSWFFFEQRIDRIVSELPIQNKIRYNVRYNESIWFWSNKLSNCSVFLNVKGLNCIVSDVFKPFPHSPYSLSLWFCIYCIGSKIRYNLCYIVVFCIICL